MSSMLGAAGIAFGIAMALLMFHESTTDTIHPESQCTDPAYLLYDCMYRICMVV